MAAADDLRLHLALVAEREEVVRLGGLHVVGTQRHESRRIDAQLRGRAGRQGDPGSSRFILSVDDDVFRIFGGERVKAIFSTMRLSEDTPIESKQVRRARAPRAHRRAASLRARDAIGDHLRALV